MPRLAARRYLEPLIASGARTVVLGCTHFPLHEATVLRESADLAGQSVAVVDSARACADDVAAFLDARGLAHAGPDRGSLELLVTDLPKSFATVAARFLGAPALDVRAIDL